MEKLLEAYELIEEGILFLEYDNVIFANKSLLDLFKWNHDQIYQKCIDDVPLVNIHSNRQDFVAQVRDCTEFQKIAECYFSLKIYGNVVKVCLKSK